MQIAIGCAVVVSDTLSADAIGAATAPSDRIIATDAMVLAYFLFIVRTFRRQPLEGWTGNSGAGRTTFIVALAQVR
ncbi:hypothetical protein AB0L57_06160 [Nocardia sp. NPDC052254]|uniref:hypothetical protein n=1 Tax=Nocardia sp. NPDC052254 TaxID=3155681 RepID=UPI003432B4F5